MKGASLKRLGENKVGLKPTIPFESNKAEFNFDKDTDAKNIVYIKVNIDPLCDTADRTYIMKKSVSSIQTLNKKRCHHYLDHKIIEFRYLCL